LNRLSLYLFQMLFQIQVSVSHERPKVNGFVNHLINSREFQVFGVEHFLLAPFVRYII
jgi:hypothetical protein